MTFTQVYKEFLKIYKNKKSIFLCKKIYMFNNKHKEYKI